MTLKTPIEKFESNKLNSRKPVNCYENWFCKKMTCPRCRELRRDFFVKSGVEYAEQTQLDRHLVITFKIQSYADQWAWLSNNVRQLSKKMSGARVGPYIRVMSVGKKNCPHIHFLIGEKSLNKIVHILKMRFVNNIFDFHIKSVTSCDGLLGYFFDKNFIVSSHDPNRIKGLRLISASRPMPCGFPTYKRIQQMR